MTTRSPYRRTTLVVVIWIFLGAAALAQPQSGLQITPDGKRTLISKDVGDERWAITRNVDDGTITGNVFHADGGAPQFVWCTPLSESEQEVVFDCLGADACPDEECAAPVWTFVRQVTLPQSFFLPAAPAPVVAAARAGQRIADAARASGLQMTPDHRLRALVNKDVGAERWAITRHTTDNTVTGNVFSELAANPTFLWCDEVAASSGDVRLSCFAAPPCIAAPCSPEQWTFVSEVTIGRSFFGAQSQSCPDVAVAVLRGGPVPLPPNPALTSIFTSARNIDPNRVRADVFDADPFPPDQAANVESWLARVQAGCPDPIPAVLIGHSLGGDGVARVGYQHTCSRIFLDAWDPDLRVAGVPILDQRFAPPRNAPTGGKVFSYLAENLYNGLGGRPFFVTGGLTQTKIAGTDHVSIVAAVLGSNFDASVFGQEIRRCMNPCSDLSGSWSYSESGALDCSSQFIDFEDELPFGGSGNAMIEQNGCDVAITVSGQGVTWTMHGSIEDDVVTVSGPADVLLERDDLELPGGVELGGTWTWEGAVDREELQLESSGTIRATFSGMTILTCDVDGTHDLSR